jgi:hypothetical protein
MNRPRNDECHAVDDNRITTGPGRYLLAPPMNHCRASFADEPGMIVNGVPAAHKSKFGQTDVESDLRNLNRPLTECQTFAYRSGDSAVERDGLEERPISHFSKDYTQLTNPACTLRGSGMGINRFEWLAVDPQQHIMTPFDTNVSARILVKDMHRPCVPTPLNQQKALPAPAHYTQPARAAVASTDLPPGVLFNRPQSAWEMDPPMTADAQRMAKETMASRDIYGRYSKPVASTNPAMDMGFGVTTYMPRMPVNHSWSKAVPTFPPPVQWR